MKLFYAIATLSMALLLVLFLAFQPKAKPVVIAVSSWPGYTPLFYAKEKGWLDALPLQIFHVSSLHESIRLYTAGLCDGLATTNDVALRLRQRYDLTPVLFFDRSDGADKILSNRSLHELNTTHGDVEVFLEMESVNRLLFEGFLAYYGFDRQRFKLHDISQEFMVDIPPQKIPTLFITYEPFASLLMRRHYEEIASSILPTVTILDLLIVKTSSAETYRKVFHELQPILFQAIEKLNSDPREYYATIRHYLEGQTFERFMQSLKGLKFVETSPDDTRCRRLYQQQEQQP